MDTPEWLFQEYIKNMKSWSASLKRLILHAEYIFEKLHREGTFMFLATTTASKGFLTAGRDKMSNVYQVHMPSFTRMSVCRSSILF